VLTSVTGQICVILTTATKIPDTRLCSREITGKYAIIVVLKHAQMWN
jgi:hypothetical protein